MDTAPRFQWTAVDPLAALVEMTMGRPGGPWTMGAWLPSGGVLVDFREYRAGDEAALLKTLTCWATSGLEINYEPRGAA